MWTKKVKLLGVELDYQLNFDPQVTNLCKKAAKQLNVLQRLSKFLNVSTRLIIFKSCIRLNFNFCPLIWHFCSKSNTEKLEKLQFRALRIVFNDYESSYDTLLKKVNSTTIHLNRLRLIASETFKCIHNLFPEYLQSLVKVKFSTYNFRYSNILETPQVRTTRYGKNSFRFELYRCGTASQRTFAQSINIKTLYGWSAPGRVQNVNAPCVSKLLLTFFACLLVFFCYTAYIIILFFSVNPLFILLGYSLMYIVYVCFLCVKKKH